MMKIPITLTITLSSFLITAPPASLWPALFDVVAVSQRDISKIHNPKKKQSLATIRDSIELQWLYWRVANVW